MAKRKDETLRRKRARLGKRIFYAFTYQGLTLESTKGGRS